MSQYETPLKLSHTHEHTAICKTILADDVKFHLFSGLDVPSRTSVLWGKVLTIVAEKLYAFVLDWGNFEWRTEPI
jgi:hypothetical protein